MTPKELLYVEDVLGHSKDMETSFNDFSNTVQDQELKTFLQQISQKNKTCFDKMFTLLNK